MFICISISRKTDWCPSVPLYFQYIEVSLEEKLEGSIAPMIEQNFLCFTGYADLEVLWRWLMKCAADDAMLLATIPSSIPLPHESPIPRLPIFSNPIWWNQFWTHVMQWIAKSFPIYQTDKEPQSPLSSSLLPTWIRGWKVSPSLLGHW